jgi:hypothetical protein
MDMVEAQRVATAARDAGLRPVLEEMRGRPYREIAAALTDRGIEAPRGGAAWNAMTVLQGTA